MAESKIPEKRALVIGIDDYEYANKLENAVKDAKAMESTLKSIGFSVTRKTNLTRDAMERVLFDFKMSIKENDTVIFYFSGHGIQWEVCTNDL